LLAVGYTQKVVIVGAGISGLACAFRLKQLGVRYLVLEAHSRAGGVIATIRRNGYLFERGPQCPRFPAVAWHLVRELGLDKEFLAGDRKAKRYIFRSGQLQLAPFSPGRLLATGLLGRSSKFRILAEAFARTKPPSEEESLAEFVERKFGTEVLENLVDPIVSTVFFADAYKMGMQSAFPALVDWERNQGSLVRGALRARSSKRADNSNGATAEPRPNGTARSMKVTDALPSPGSFGAGMARLPERLAEEQGQQIRYSVEVESATQRNAPDGGGPAGWQIRTSEGEEITSAHLILCVPAYEAARILRQAAPTLASELESIEYAPMRGIASGYDRRQVQNPLEGFGFMVPRKEGLRTICTFWNSSLFPGRAPEGKISITSFVRNEANQGSSLANGSAETIEAENAAILGIAGEPEDREVWTLPRALPQYNVGHSGRVAAVNRALSTVPQLDLVGNYLQGRSIGDCVERAFRVAESVHSPIPQKRIEPAGSWRSE
jgi:oxygen-dependent protoporphyrinogen oxidase